MKGSEHYGDLAERLMEELNCETVFTIPVFGGILSWIRSGIVDYHGGAGPYFPSAWRNLKVENPERSTGAGSGNRRHLQILLMIWLEKKGEYIPYLISVAIYIGVANLIGLIGFKPPTKDLNATAALALMSIVLIEYAGFHKKDLRDG